MVSLLTACRPLSGPLASCGMLAAMVAAAVNGLADAQIGAAAAEIAVHRGVDILRRSVAEFFASSAAAAMICPAWQ